MRERCDIVIRNRTLEGNVEGGHNIWQVQKQTDNACAHTDAHYFSELMEIYSEQNLVFFTLLNRFSQCVKGDLR